MEAINMYVAKESTVKPIACAYVRSETNTEATRQKGAHPGTCT